MAKVKTVKAPKYQGAKLDRKILLAIVACLALSVIAYIAFVAPQRKAASAAKAKAAAAVAQQNQAAQRIASIKSGKQTGAQQLLEQARALDQEIPVTVDKVALVAQVPTEAQQYGVTVGSMDPADSSGTSGTSGTAASTSQSFSITATGSLSGLTSWIGHLLSQQATMTVSGVTVTTGGAPASTDGSGASSGTGGASATFTLTAYFDPSATLPQ